MKKNRTLRGALVSSIKHWKQDIVKPLKEGRDLEASHFASDCALCQFLNHNHQSCPLLWYRNGCNGFSAWAKFNDLQTLENAQAMVADLKEVLKKYDADREKGGDEV